MEIYFFFLLEFFFAICNSVQKESIHTLPVWLEALYYQYGWKFLFLLERSDNSWGFFASVVTAVWWKLATLWSANASRSLLIIAKTVLQQRVRSLHLTAERCLTFLEFVTLHAVYYTLSQAKFLCSSMNYNSCLFPKSKCTYFSFSQNSQKKQLLLPRPLEGIGWDVEEQLYVPSVMSNTEVLWLGPKREHSSLQPWPHQLHSTTFPWSWCSTFSKC